MQCNQLSTLLVGSEWDSTFFGFPVAEINNTDVELGQLEKVLRYARVRGDRLVYWKTDPRVAAPNHLLQEFRGTLVDEKVVYRLTLSEPVSPAGPDYVNHIPWHIVEYTARVTLPQLVSLALAAGQHSRFRVDPRFPRSLFRALYEEWIRRSVSHEVADIVFAAYLDNDIPVGLVTVSSRPGHGEIGLISVSDLYRGQGIGRALLDRAHRWMAEQGASESQVTTQRTNESACAVYERCGYIESSATSVYHFWP